MDDRLYRGFVAGTIGGIVSSLLGQLSYILGLTTLRSLDWAALLIFAHTLPYSLGEQLFAEFIYIGWCGAIGSLFAYFLVWTTNRKILFKAWMLGTTPYFLIYLLTSLFQTPGTVPTPLNTALSNYITASISSLIMGYSFKVLDQAILLKHSPLKILAHPAAKHASEGPNQDEE